MTASERTLLLLEDSSTPLTGVWSQAVYAWENKQGSCSVSLKGMFEHMAMIRLSQTHGWGKWISGCRKCCLCSSWQLEMKQGTPSGVSWGHNTQSKVLTRDRSKKSNIRHLISPQVTLFHQYIKPWQYLNSKNFSKDHRLHVFQRRMQQQHCAGVF